jgi:hypothetical protein
MINVQMILPEFDKMVHRSLNEKSIPHLSFSHTAFKDNEHELLGSAVKYCYLKHINVIILGEPNTNNTRSSEEICETRDPRTEGRRGMPETTKLSSDEPRLARKLST